MPTYSTTSGCVPASEGTWYCSRHKGHHLSTEIPFGECTATLGRVGKKKNMSNAYQEALDWIGLHEGSIRGELSNGTMGKSREWGIVLKVCPIIDCPICTVPGLSQHHQQRPTMFQLRLYDKIMYIVHSHHEQVPACSSKSIPHICHKYDGQVLIIE